MIRLALLQILYLLMVTLNASMANDVYIAQAGAGLANGTTAQSAYPVSYFNDPSNWSSSPTGTLIGPGTTVHLCGTISTSLTAQGSGTAGNVVTILFEPNAAMSAPNWPAGYVISIGANNYFTIDGGSNGLITARNQNSTSGLVSNGIAGAGASNIEVKNLSITHLYDRTISTDLHGNVGIWFVYGNNISIHDNVVMNAEKCINYAYQGGGVQSRNIFIYNNKCSGANWGIGVGSGNTNAWLDNLQVYNNNITASGTMWDEPNDTFHHNSIYCYAEASGARITNLRLYNNYAHGAWGQMTTSHFYLSAVLSPGGLEGAMVYNNVVFDTGGGNSPPCGCIFLHCTGFHCLNNTIIAANGQGGIGIRVLSDGGSPDVGDIRNNILYNWKNPIYQVAGVSSLTNGNNLINVDPLVVSIASGDGHLKADSPAIGTGVNLFSMFTIDKDGNARPQVGPWCAGAYQYAAIVAPGPPSNLRVVAP